LIIFGIESVFWQHQPHFLSSYLQAPVLQLSHQTTNSVAPAVLQESLQHKSFCLFFPFVYQLTCREPTVVGKVAHPEYQTERLHRPVACMALDETISFSQVGRLKMAKAFLTR
jgi:hypothetical protein